MFEFASPWVFGLFILPAFIYFFMPKAKQQQSGLKVPFFQHVSHLQSGEKKSGSTNTIFKIIFLVLIWLLLLTSAAKPQWVGEEINLPASGRDLFVAVDISMSMVDNYMIIDNQYIPRLDVVKYVVGEFVDKREGDRIGLVLFGSNAYLQSPLTFDRATIKEYIYEAQAGFAGRATAIGDAIGLSVKRLRDRPEGKRVVILLTDGENTSGEISPRKAADLAKKAGVKIYTIGFSEKSRGLDEQTLQYVATTTGGEYLRARSPQELNRAYTLFDSLEPIEQEEETFRPTSTLYFWPLLGALGLSFFYTIIFSSILRPRNTATPQEKTH